MPRGYAPGSISAGFQGTHGPRRAWNTPPGLVDGARGAGAGPPSKETALELLAAIGDLVAAGLWNVCLVSVLNGSVNTINLHRSAPWCQPARVGSLES